MNLKLRVRALICLTLFCASAAALHGQAIDEGEELAQLQLTVVRTGETIPINQVGKLVPGDRLRVSIATAYNGVSFDSLGYKRISVLFVPGTSEQLDQVKNDSNGFQSKALRKDGSGDSACYRTCDFLAPNYRSFPVVFFVSSGGYSGDLRNLANEQDFRALKRLGGQNNTLVIAARKLAFLDDVAHLLDTPAADSTKVIQVLYNKATTELKLFEGTTCQNAVDKKIEGAANSFTERSKSQLKCLIRENQVLLSRFEELRSKGIKLDIKSVVYFFAEASIGILLKKIPSLGLYFDIAKAVIAVVAELLKKDPLAIRSSFLKPLSASNGDYVLVKTPPAEHAEQKPIPAGAERALFFVPIDYNKDEPQSDVQMRAWKPRPTRECITNGENYLAFNYGTLQDKYLTDAKIRIANPDDGSEYFDTANVEVSDAHEAFKFRLTDQEWERIGGWTSVSGTLSLIYATKKYDYSFMLPRPKNSAVTLNPETLKNFRKGADRTLELDEPVPGCVEKYELTIGEKRFKASYQSKKLEFKRDVLDGMPAGKGQLLLYQYSIPQPMEISVELKDFLPAVNAVKSYEGDNFGVVEGDRLSQLRTAVGAKVGGTITYLDPGGKQLSSEAVEYYPDENRFYFKEANAKFPKTGSGFHLTLDVDGFPVQSARFTVLKSRPTLKADVESSCNGEPNQVNVRVKSTALPSNYPYEFDKCVSPLDATELELVLPAAIPKYTFTRETAYRVFVRSALTESHQDDNPGVEFKTQPATMNRFVSLRIGMDNSFGPELSDDGVRLYLRVVDTERGISDWYPIGQRFVTPPSSLTLDCTHAEPNPCLLTGDLSTISQVAVGSSNGAPNWIPVKDGDDSVALPQLSYPDYFFIQAHNDPAPIKVKNLASSNRVKFILAQARSSPPNQNPAPK